MVEKILAFIISLCLTLAVSAVLIHMTDFPVDNNSIWIGCCLVAGLVFSKIT